jgi:predicted O-methyltransferase YrrM
MWDVVSRPSSLSMLLQSPSEMAPVDATLALFPEGERDQAEAWRFEFVSNHSFFEEYARRYVAIRRSRPVWNTWCDGRSRSGRDFIYLVVRALRPAVICETGVFDGQSSAVILQALADNGEGILVSIDLPASSVIEGSTHEMIYTTLPPGQQPGWAISDDLRARHRILLGDSRDILPQLIEEHPTIDLFFHDSLHTFEHMTYEYDTAWPALREGGILLSDDVGWNAAFHRFCKEHRRDYVLVGGLGATRK